MSSGVPIVTFVVIITFCVAEEEEVSELSEVLMFLAKSAEEKSSRPAPKAKPSVAVPQETLPTAPAPAPPPSNTASVSPPKPPSRSQEATSLVDVEKKDVSARSTGERAGGPGRGGRGAGGRYGRGSGGRGRGGESSVPTEDSGESEDGDSDDDDDWVGMRRKIKKKVASPDGRAVAANPLGGDSAPGFWGAYGAKAPPSNSLAKERETCPVAEEGIVLFMY